MSDNWDDYPSPEIHVIKTPPPGEPLDEYIKRRVGEEIARQLSEVHWLDKPVPVERPTEEE